MPTRYDATAPKSIESFGKQLINGTLRQASGEHEIPQRDLKAKPGVNTKGNFGGLVERYYYGINPGNESCTPDFKDAGVELKTNSLLKGKGGLYSKERLVLEMISYSDIVQETFDSSCFMRKSKLMMLVSNMYSKDSNIVDAKIAFAGLIDFNHLPLADQAILREDWSKIVAKIREGKAHLLSGADTTYLEACTKAANGSKRVNQPFSTEKARPRALALKAGYVTSLVRGRLGNDEQIVVTDAATISDRGFEATIVEHFERFRGKDVTAIHSELGIEIDQGSKGYFASLARGMIGVSSRSVAEFTRAGITMKTMMTYENGSPREHMSFPIFKYMGPGSILEEIWDAGDDEQAAAFRTILEERRFLLVVFKNSSGVITLEKVRFWSMPGADIEAYVRPAWEATRTAIFSGNIHDLPGQSFNHVCHVRPHGRNSEDTLPTPRNGNQVKRSFWLDKAYLIEQLNQG
jgi:DNA mismatch repair protein MutH